MKSKSFNSNTAAATLKQNRSFDFVKLYKSATETSVSFSDRHKSGESNETESPNVTSESIGKSSKRKKEKRETIDISHIVIDGPGMTNNNGGSTPLNYKVTSTPLSNQRHQSKSCKVKSIMKNSLGMTDDTRDGSKLDVLTTKPKKRNKSVSFMLEDGEEVIIKKTKSDDSSSETKSENAPPKVKVVNDKRQLKKVKKSQIAEKENKINDNQTLDLDNSIKEKPPNVIKTKPDKSQSSEMDVLEPTTDNQDTNKSMAEIKKKRKKVKKVKISVEDTESKESIATESTSHELSQKIKKNKKKKHQAKPQNDLDNEEPASKSRKTDAKPDVVAELENLSIGDNPHTLTNLLDEMTVVDKDKRKKLKQKFNKNKKPKGTGNTDDSEKMEDSQEKVKWRRRKWNKDMKTEAKEVHLETAVIVENLPLSLLFHYKRILAEHFVKYGLIKSVGIAEVYTTEELKPVFTTTINFYSDGAATQALEEDNTLFEGHNIRVKRPLPATDTTLVVRSYGSLTAQCISSTFSSAGRIRNIRHSVKGKHAMATFFIEFDGPESVARAMKLATDVKIGGKKIYVSKFEVRTKKCKIERTNDNEGSDADQSEDSQD